MKRLLSIFAISFVLNIVWENLHSYLYDNYMGGKITEFILLRASLADALAITILLIPFLYISFFRKRNWLVILGGIIISILIEWHGLGTGRWSYNDYMPIIPILSVGLTPTIQLGILGYLSFIWQEYILSHHLSSKK